jgi:hypothetical protein
MILQQLWIIKVTRRTRKGVNLEFLEVCNISVGRSNEGRTFSGEIREEIIEGAADDNACFRMGNDDNLLDVLIQQCIPYVHVCIADTRSCVPEIALNKATNKIQ